MLRNCCPDYDGGEALQRLTGGIDSIDFLRAVSCSAAIHWAPANACAFGWAATECTPKTGVLALRGRGSKDSLLASRLHPEDLLSPELCATVDLQALLASWSTAAPIRTFTGRSVRPLDIDPVTLDIVDIAHGLSNLCRFSGQCRSFYSVAEHSVRVSRILPESLALWGLLHDAAEAYLVDFPRPLKQSRGLGQLYKLAETRAMQVIAHKYGLPWPEPAAVKRADEVVLATELRDLFVLAPPGIGAVMPLVEVIVPWPPEVAFREFSHSFQQLMPP